MAKNGGYTIVDFKGQAPETLDATFFDECLKRGKPIWVNNLVVNGETYSGVGSLKKTLTSIIVAIASINIVIALSDGSTTYEASAKTYQHKLLFENSNQDQGSIVIINNKETEYTEEELQNALLQKTIYGITANGDFNIVNISYLSNNGFVLSLSDGTEVNNATFIEDSVVII